MDSNILEAVQQGKNDCGPKCSKYRGALTVELIRSALKQAGFVVSDRDVYIKGIPIEIDLMILKSDSNPANRILYDAADVLAVLEIKSRGSFGESSIKEIRGNFNLIKSTNNNIACLYMTLSERKTYKWKVTPENIHSPAYTLFWNTGTEDKLKFEQTGDWTKFITDIKRMRR